MATKQTTKGIKPTWLYDKQGNIKEVHQPVNGKGQPISLNPQTMTGGLHDSVGFSKGSNSMYEDHNKELQGLRDEYNRHVEY